MSNASSESEALEAFLKLNIRKKMIIISLIGMIIKNRYCILEAIGKGGEGKLYLARDIELGVLWAVKEIPREKQREARLLRTLSHPLLPKMIDYAENEEYCYLVMEYIQGDSLKELIDRNKGLSEEIILKCAIEIADILAYLHEIKPPVFYADLKPENIMLSTKGRVYLVDFGSAVLGYAQRHSISSGTPGYAAPEQYKGIIDAQSDIYTFGRTIYALFKHKKHILYLKYPKLVRLIWRCTRNNPKFRYKSMKTIEKNLWEIVEKRRETKVKGRYKWVFMSVLLLTTGGIFMSSLSGNGTKNIDFYQKLTDITDQYYSEDFINGSQLMRKKKCQKIEKQMEQLLLNSEEEERRKILKLLAFNGEWISTEKAEFYYKQLLLYDGIYRESYILYGLFLCKQEKIHSSRKLWKIYVEKEKSGVLQGEAGMNYEKWKEYMER